jgi:hypothetical protein
LEVKELIEKSIIDFKNKIEIFEDPNFIFIEDSHKYTYDDINFESVTTFIKNFKEEFDKEYWSKRKAAERGVDVDVVLNEWNKKGDIANELGTKVHNWIEDFWMGRNPEIPANKGEYRNRCIKFMDIYNSSLISMVPLKSELRVFSKKWRLAGTIDQPFLYWDEKLAKVLFLVGDWKTNKEFKDDNHPNGKWKRLLRPFRHLYANHHNEYSIQISLYRLILEEAGIETHGGFMCHIGPEGNPKLYPVVDVREILRSYLDQNRVYT